MSSWTVITFRARAAEDYEYTRSEGTDPWDALADLVATIEEDNWVRKWTVWSPHVYAYLDDNDAEFEHAEALIEDHSEMIHDAVVLRANDTSSTGIANYYPVAKVQWDTVRCTDSYEEIEHGDVGELALAVMNARHGLISRDPFHNQAGRLDEDYLNEGVVRE